MPFVFPRDEKACDEGRPTDERSFEGDRPAAERFRDGDRPAGERSLDGDCPAGERSLDGDRPADERPLDGDRPPVPQATACASPSGERDKLRFSSFALGPAFASAGATSLFTFVLAFASAGASLFTLVLAFASAGTLLLAFTSAGTSLFTLGFLSGVRGLSARENLGLLDLPFETMRGLFEAARRERGLCSSGPRRRNATAGVRELSARLSLGLGERLSLGLRDRGVRGGGLLEGGGLGKCSGLAHGAALLDAALDAALSPSGHSCSSSQIGLMTPSNIFRSSSG